MAAYAGRKVSGRAVAAPPPVVIGGVGFSGTRVVMRIARRAGLFMGRHLNASEDSLDFFELSERWSARRHAAWEAGDPLYAPWRLRRDLRRSIEAHRGPMEDPAAPWGWKQPRSIHFLPLLHRRYPDMRFIHVIRDGRDLAFGRETAFRIAVGVDGSGVYSAASGMTNDLDKQPAPVRMAAFWESVNVLAADYGEREMGDFYRRVRLEDICTNPSDVVRELFDFVGADADPDVVRATAADVVWPRTIGLHRRVDDHALLERVTATGAPALERFRYAGASFERPGELIESLPADALLDEQA
jgi:Sulfotransferase family